MAHHNIQANSESNSGQDTAVQRTDYAHARTHNQPAPVPEPCPNIMDMGGSTGENAVSCGLDCWFYCEICEVSACTKSCMKAQGCDHEVTK